MYRKPKFLAILHEIRETMSREADYDVDLFTEMVRTGAQPGYGPRTKHSRLQETAAARARSRGWRFDRATTTPRPK